MDKAKCLSCEIANGLKVPDGGLIFKGEYFNAHQDIKYSIPGLIILASNRHFKWLKVHFVYMQKAQSF